MTDAERAYKKEYRAKNKEKIAAYRKKWDALNKEKRKAYQKVYQSNRYHNSPKTKTAIKATVKAYHEKNRDKRLKQMKAYRQANVLVYKMYNQFVRLAKKDITVSKLDSGAITA